MLEELKYLRRRNEELSYNDKECQANKAKINQLEGELNTLKDQTSALHAQNIKLKQDSEAARNQPPGQLPDLDPGKVSIIQPALNGTNGIIESPFFLNYYFIIHNANFGDLFLDTIPTAEILSGTANPAQFR